MIAVDRSDMDAGMFASRPAFLVVDCMERLLAVVAPGGNLDRPHGLFQLPKTKSATTESSDLLNVSNNGTDGCNGPYLQ